MVKNLRVILFYFYTYIRAQVVLPSMYYLKVAHGTGLITVDEKACSVLSY